MLSNEEADILVNNQVLMPDFHVYEVGFEHCRPTKPVEYVPIDYWVLHYCVSGEGYFSLTGTTEKHIQSGDLFMIPAHFGNRYYPKASNPWTYRWIGLSGQAVQNLLARCQLSEKQFVIPGRYDEVLNQFFEDCYNQFKEGHQFGAVGETFALLDYLKTRETSINSMNANEYLLLTITKYIKIHFAENLTVTKIAQQHNIDRSYLFKLFQKYKQTTPSHYIQNLKLQKACSLLRKSSLSVTDVSYEAGFTSSSYFTKFFQSNMGLSPLQYRHKFVLK
ncbi:AraC family transcriptional regulator [Latilactobacillus fuchuensis]|uniref:AraC family transcriptional regulator n=1 Tax=Latilactobacillus fuchuensis DSM 14340 = JCM 11249 TaxID=1423747 RepID=A0A0R1S1M5_9LACO|nr:AraC family transcriptional regulator [Latilactobacillus fuchuensis]KRL59875.1 AraC family transcriptional regulator [Latilactobacillus fuchuensis DSM 14340 = JCM 11249]MCP8857010.1 AraC family transcriptional regulator [Latilactobacillus fuchuensis]